MLSSLENAILAAITIHPERVMGAVAVFIVKDEKEAQTLASVISHVLDGMAHDLGNGTLIIVRH